MENEELLKEVTAKAQTWLGAGFDADTRKEVQAMLDNADKTDLIESFYRVLEFGTGGLRGIMGAGTNRMNKYTVGMATQGLANYLHKAFPQREKISVVVGHDCRNNSRFFAETVADIFSANGIFVYLFESLRPTPEISFAIRELGCQSGVNITASHNPKEYNGYKAYWDDGAQVLSPHDTGIIDEVNRVKVEDIKFERNADLIKIIGGDMDVVYLDAVRSARIDPEVIKRHENLKIVYTPIHGTGRVIIPASLRYWGFKNVTVVPEQMVIDGNFPTVVSPNPENAEALTLALNLGTKIDADLVIASDPDADRLGIACRDDKGEWVLINGNQTCMMYSYYIITNMKKLGKLQGNEFLVKTIVTSELIRKIADRNGVKLYDEYTGFKWIAYRIRQLEGKEKYIGGGEESYGFLPYDKVRDKDSPASVSLIAEIAAWAKDNGMTLYQLLQQIYVDYGFQKEKAVSVVKPGKSGAEEIKAMMENFRQNPPQEIGGSKVAVIKDYLSLEQKEVATGKVSKLEMPTTANVLQYFTEDGTKISVRPSGTEPKIKFYCEVPAEMKTREDYAAANAAADAKLKKICASLGI
jgi:phosphoglucomutase